MSRRRGEFEHRTSIFEGAFRAWSHLGGLEAEDLETKTAAQLDPLSYPLEDDQRLSNKGDCNDGGNPDRRIYPYEPLPRTGLSHPFVQAILSPWLGPDADQDAIQLGLTTLRTWWQHRRKGESGSAVAALGTDKMRGVVEGYTRHFFNLAHCLVTQDREQPPRTLNTKMRAREKILKKGEKKHARDKEAKKLADLAITGMTEVRQQQQQQLQAPVSQEPFLDDPSLTPLERLHFEQRRQLEIVGGISNSLAATLANQHPIVDMRGKCVPGKLDLPQMVDKVSAAANQLAHRGAMAVADPVTSGSSPSQQQQTYGDPNTTPVVFVSQTGDIQIAMTVEGITCAHCVKIVETVLRGCNGNRSPIDGLLDAAADRVLCMVLIKIDKSSNAKRIAFEAARNLSLVGYSAKAKEMSIVDVNSNNDGSDPKAKMDLGLLSTAFEVVATTEPRDVFDWNIPCRCPDNGVLREDCARHSQMNKRIFEAFETREQLVTEYMAGCGMKYGMECTCGPNCRCKNCEKHNRNSAQQAQDDLGSSQNIQDLAALGLPMPQASGPMPTDGSFPFLANMPPMQPRGSLTRGSMLSYGGTFGRHMSITSEGTFGRAMSGLSALSIDWENELDGFDLTVDYSAHINNTGATGAAQASNESRDASETIMAGCAMLEGGECNCGPSCLCVGCPTHDNPANLASQGRIQQHRPSLRRNATTASETAQNMPHVSFQV